MVSYSVIVPVYNGEEYIERCISSVLSQTRADLELIIINDGSRDKTDGICRKLKSADGRIKYIATENHGVSYARNLGIEASTGEYIGFVDSDDTVARDMYEKMIAIAEAETADVVVCDSTTVYSDGTTEEDTLPNIADGEKLTKEALTPEKMMYIAGGACRCLYRRRVIEENGIRFPLGIKLSEDRAFNILAMGAASAVCYTKHPLYFRYVLKGSAVNKYRGDYLQTVLDSYDALNKALIRADFSNDHLNAYKSNIAYGALSAIYNEFHADCPHRMNDKRRIIKQICENKAVQNAISDKCGDLKLKLIKNKNVNLLILMCTIRKLMGR